MIQRVANVNTYLSISANIAAGDASIHVACLTNLIRLPDIIRSAWNACSNFELLREQCHRLSLFEMPASGSFRHQDAHRDDIGFYLALPSLFTVMELSCATVPLGFCKSKTSVEANNSDTLAQNKSRERVGEGDSESE